jgi:hypothetical protein
LDDKVIVICSDIEAFKYDLKELPKVLKERFIASGGDFKSARYTQFNGRWGYIGDLNPCYDLSDMD